LLGFCQLVVASSGGNRWLYVPFCCVMQLLHVIMFDLSVQTSLSQKKTTPNGSPQTLPAIRGHDFLVIAHTLGHTSS
jgi:hypothetical protein